MGFYESIADYYEQIFPDSPAKANFVKDSFGSLEGLSLLDIGCAVGKTAIALAQECKQVIALDLDEKMIDMARNNSRSMPKKPVFHTEDMAKIAKRFDAGRFDGILCFGNTLVHLNSLARIKDFLEQARTLLTPKGKLLLQIINYDRILDNQLSGLPSIENDRIRFVRNYNYSRETGLINFETQLTDKQSGLLINNTVELYPLRKHDLENILGQAGFSGLNFFGSFKRDIYTADSIPLVVEAS
jgi:glycine/sarcosine N-methyltransferase